MKCTSNSWEVDGRSVDDEAVRHDREIGCACGAESECRRIVCQDPSWEIQVMKVDPVPRVQETRRVWTGAVGSTMQRMVRGVER